MKKLFQRLFALSTAKQTEPIDSDSKPAEVEKPPVEPEMPLRPVPAPYTPSISFWINRLTAVESDPQKQLQKRLEAFEKIQEAGSTAGEAIPALIDKLFADNAAESAAAKSALAAVAADWPLQEHALGKIPFLIRKLGKDHQTAGKAIWVLQEMGERAATALLDTLKNDQEQDAYFLSNALKAIPESVPVETELLPLFEKWLSTTQNTALAEAALETAHKKKWTSADMVKLALGLTKHEQRNVREKAVALIDESRVAAEWVAPELLQCLSDESRELREAASRTLSRIDSPLADTFYGDVVKGQGVISAGAMKGMFDKIGLWGKHEIALYQFNPEQFINNLSWYFSKLHSDLEKPRLLLNSVLSILQSRSDLNPDWIELLLEIVRKDSAPETTKQAVLLLGKYRSQTETLLPVILEFLSHPDEQVRQSALVSLHQLDEHWLQREESVRAIQLLVDHLDGNTRRISQQSLLAIGAPALPILNDRLEQMDNRIVQEALLDILDKLGGDAAGSLPALLKLQAISKNVQTLEMIKGLIGKLGGGSGL